ncbi:MAG: hypothetical protein IMW91_05790 [Firmicutes bacterium]|nr:hypothetical protein [Bacillota bacterium]
MQAIALFGLDSVSLCLLRLLQPAAIDRLVVIDDTPFPAPLPSAAPRAAAVVLSQHFKAKGTQWTRGLVSAGRQEDGDHAVDCNQWVIGNTVAEAEALALAGKKAGATVLRYWQEGPDLCAASLLPGQPFGGRPTLLEAPLAPSESLAVQLYRWLAFPQSAALQWQAVYLPPSRSLRLPFSSHVDPHQIARTLAPTGMARFEAGAVAFRRGGMTGVIAAGTLRLEGSVTSDEAWQLSSALSCGDPWPLSQAD